ncbi:MAG TPA: sigma-70 family RNA polymerase sigma factor [Longimicrobiaceae bacterium]|nr:sigma-70 family RNA polymerase sigma factor [Longimicrobiaceae bacterium]
MDVERLYREHSPALFRFLVRFTGDAEAAADAVQETFTRLVERPPRSEQARSWLFRVATNVVREAGRTRIRRLRLLEAVPGESLVGDGPDDPGVDFDRRERRRKVQEALALLSPRDRMVLLMRAEGFSHREIAAAAGTTTGSVGTILARALEKLADRLPLDEGGPP